MPFDADLILRDGLVDLDANEAAAVATTVNADGAYALDLKKTAVKGMAAVIVLPTAPTTYADTLAVSIQESDHVDGDYKTIASFPTLYAMMRRIKASASVAAAVIGDIGQVLTGGTTTDTGEIRFIEEALYTLNGKGYIYVTMQGADDLFDDDDEAITSAGTFSGVVDGEAAVVSTFLSGANFYVCRFASNKRYIRGLFTASAGSNFGKVFCGLTPYPFDTL